MSDKPELKFYSPDWLYFRATNEVEGGDFDKAEQWNKQMNDKCEAELHQYGDIRTVRINEADLIQLEDHGIKLRNIAEEVEKPNTGEEHE